MFRSFRSVIRRAEFLVCASLLVAAGFARSEGAPEAAAHVTVTLDPSAGKISRKILGFNTSYFNDLDSVWDTGHIEGRLRAIHTGILRYPGGAETSRFHWEQPGVNGYVDVWDPNPAHHDQHWQTTWVDPKEWNSTTRFVGFDQFVRRTGRIGAEPLIGINMASGHLFNREADGVAEAVRWIRHARQIGVRLHEVYLDNEPWNEPSGTAFERDAYAHAFVRYALALRAEDPDLKFIANPVSDLHEFGKIAHFMEIAGAETDYLDFHCYWDATRASVERWKSEIPLQNSNEWRPEVQTETYTEDFQKMRSFLIHGGYGKTGLVALEWNLDPGTQAPDAPTANDQALMQGELFLQLVQADLDMACLWPLFWQVSTAAPQTKTPPSSLTGPFLGYPPYSPNPTYRVFQLLAGLPGSRRISSSSDRPDLVSLAAAPSPGRTILFLLNKSKQATEVTVSLRKGTIRPGRGIFKDGMSEADGSIQTEELFPTRPDSILVHLAPWSLTRIDLR